MELELNIENDKKLIQNLLQKYFEDAKEQLQFYQQF